MLLKKFQVTPKNKPQLSLRETAYSQKKLGISIGAVNEVIVS
jgi:hypothetical protein